METTVLKYNVIKDKSQYEEYYNQLEGFFSGGIDNAIQDEIDLLTL
jgi:HTH-type transcriptional regulator/antitoxin HigA